MSTFRLTHLAGVALLAVVVAAGTANASVTGMQAFSDIGQPLAGGSSTGDLNTAANFTVDELTSTRGQTGIFVGMPREMNAAFTFSPSVASSMLIFNSVFGKFQSTSIKEIEDVSTSVAFDVIGNWTPGSFFHVGNGPFQALFTISFTQTPGHTGLISDSATFSIPVGVRSVVPEPSSGLLVLTGLLVGFGIYGFRRHRHPIVTT